MLHRGRLSSLEFTVPPKEILSSADVKIARLREWLDPMRADARDVPQEGPPVLSGQLRAWIEEHSISDLRKPQSRNDINAHLAQFGIVVPNDYRELINQTDGLRIGNCTVLGPSRIRKIVLPEKTICVLVEIMHRGIIGVEQQSESGELLFLSNEDNEFRSIGYSLLAALDQECVPEGLDEPLL
jgi:hypothetical protein